VLAEQFSNSGLAQAIDRPTLWHAAAVLLAWTVVFIAAAYRTLAKQDLPYEG